MSANVSLNNEDYQVQIETNQAKDILKLLKKLDSSEKEAFLRQLECYNLLLESELSDTNKNIDQRLENRRILILKLWGYIPKDIRPFISDFLKSILSDVEKKEC